MVPNAKPVISAETAVVTRPVKVGFVVGVMVVTVAPPVTAQLFSVDEVDKQNRFVVREPPAFTLAFKVAVVVPIFEASTLALVGALLVLTVIEIVSESVSVEFEIG